jgi:hypothetical protein
VETELDSSIRRGEWEDSESCLLLLDLYEAWQIASGKKIVPERIRENRRPYYDALTAARAWDDGKLDVSVMAKYLEELLKGQLTDK